MHALVPAKMVTENYNMTVENILKSTIFSDLVIPEVRGP